MITIDSDNKEIKKTLRKLYELVVANGGVIHEKLTITSHNGDFQILVTGDIPDDQVIISLPIECLLPVNKYKLVLIDYKIVMLSHDKDLNEGQVAIMKTLIELYNQTGKIDTQKYISTYSLLFENKSLLKQILKSRSKNNTPFLKSCKEMSETTFYLKSFLKTRT